MPATSSMQAAEATELPATPPVILSETALAQMRVALEAEGEAVRGVRVAVVGGGCAGFQYSMSFEKGPRAGDTCWEQAGVSIFVDKHSIGYLAGCEIDWVTSPMGSSFEFKNPNVTTTCGCGSSFA